MRTAKFVTPAGHQVWVNVDHIISIAEGAAAGTADVQTLGQLWPVKGHAWNVAKRVSDAIVYGSPFEKRDGENGGEHDHTEAA